MKILKWWPLVIPAIWLYMIFFGFWIPISHGFKVGTIIDFENSGLVFKTWNGRLNEGLVNVGLFNNSAAWWEFNVEDPELINKINEAYIKHRTVIIGYQSYSFKSFKSGVLSDSIVTSIEIQ